MLRLSIWCASLLLIASPDVGAQSAPRIAPTDLKSAARVASTDLASCQVYVQLSPRTAGFGGRDEATRRPDAIAHAAALSGCMNKLAETANKTDESTEPDKAKEEKLVGHYLAFRSMKKWYRTLEGSLERDARNRDSVALAHLADLSTSFDALQSVIETQMETHHLAQPISAELISGAGFGAVGQPSAPKGVSSGAGAGVAPAAPVPDSKETESAPVVHVAWESRHFGAEKMWRSGFEISLSGKLGFMPALTLVQPKDAPVVNNSDASPTNVTATFENAFAWSMAANPTFRIARTAELSVPFEVGQFILTNDTTIEGEGDDSYIAVPIDNDVGNAAIFTSAAVELRIYRRDLALIHATKGTLSPLIRVGAGFKRDTRFSASGGALSGFDSPEQRFLLRILVGDIPVTSTDPSGQRTFSLTFGVEWERGLGSGPRVPNATRIVLRGDLNLLRALRGEKTHE